METILAQIPISFVSVGILPAQQLSELPLQQLDFESPQDHQVPEEGLRTRVSSPNVNCCCAGQAQLSSVRHDRHRTFQQVRQVFLEIQDQASKHRAVLAQERHLVHVLTNGMAVEATRVNESHDPRLDRGPGILAQPSGPSVHVPSHATVAQPIA